MIQLSLASLLLQIDQLPDAALPENVVTAANALLEAQPLEQAPQLVEMDVRIRLAFENPKPKFLILAHRRLIYHISSVADGKGRVMARLDNSKRAVAEF